MTIVEVKMDFQKIPAGKFKTHCLQIMEEVKKKRKRVTITKRNVPVAQLGPVDEKDQKVFGCLKGAIHIVGDLVEGVGESWDADS